MIKTGLYYSFNILCLLLLCNYNISAQHVGGYEGVVGVVKLMEAIQEKEGHSLKDLNYDNIEGSPYLTEYFVEGEILTLDSTLYTDLLLRYDANNEVMQLKYDEKIYAVGGSSFNVLYIKLQDKIFNKLYFKNKNSIEGVFCEILVDDDVRLYARYQVKFYDKIAAAAYTDPKPARFSDLSTEYYVNSKNDLTPILLTNKKQFIKQFNNSAILADFIKKERIKFSKEEDLVQLIQFFNANLAAIRQD